MLVNTELYRKAFQEYLRKGTPIERSIKQAQATTHYIWRTRRDDKVRSGHAERKGQIFAWENPPPGGHPGEDYGCRCTAEPYYAGGEERLTISLTGFADEGPAWGNSDFIRHYYKGGGRGVTVRQTGHLTAIVDRYIHIVRRSLQNNIASKARQTLNGPFSNDFVRTYNMTDIAFSIGDTTIGGKFSGNAIGGPTMLSISGKLEFFLRDAFADPLDVGIEAIDLGETIFENIHRPLDNYLRGRPSRPQSLGVHTGEPYAITDEWSGRFEGSIYADPNRSEYG